MNVVECAELFKDTEKFDITSLPGRELISQEESGGNILPEYQHGDLILSSGGITDDESVNCCKTCLRHLRNGKLPPLSVANNFQIGCTPLVLSGLTIPEKLLISVYRPKMYVTTLRSFAGPGTAQSALKGNTITFPQNIVKIAESLTERMGILVDHLKVVFIGSGLPSREMLKKIFTVRRERVYRALYFLIANHPLYTNITMSNEMLPEDDVPEEIYNTLFSQEDPGDEDGKEHANYTPQTTINAAEDETIVMESSGIVDIDGSSLHSHGQMSSALHSLQGTVIVPHGSITIIRHFGSERIHGYFLMEKGDQKMKRNHL